MRVEWIDDILAVLDCGSLARAAEKRHLTQSAFTRRVRMIEENIGTSLFDRRRKPISLVAGVQALEPELRDLSARLHRLRQTLRSSSDQAGKTVTFIFQHALTATASPQIVRDLTAEGEAAVRVRSGNQDECLMQLISKDVDFAIMYAIPEEISSEPRNVFETIQTGTDLLVPVCAPSLRAAVIQAAFPIISYPPEVFLGQVVSRMIGPRMPQNLTTQPVAETALTLAMLELAMSEIGVAWLPKSLMGDQLQQGKLVLLDDLLPSQMLNIRLVRLSESQSDHYERIWIRLCQSLISP